MLMDRFRSCLRLLNAWALGVVEVLALALAAIWLLMCPPVFERYYPIVKESARAADAASIVRWISSEENVFALNTGLRSGQLNRKELKHYADVRRWIRRVPAAMASLLCAGVILALISARRSELLQKAQWRGLAFLGVALGFGAVFAAWDWEVLFAWVHDPFFGPTSWKLSRGAYSLRLFPNEFWQVMGVAVIFCPALAMAGAGIVLRRGASLIRSTQDVEGPISGDASIASGR